VSLTKIVLQEEAPDLIQKNSCIEAVSEPSFGFKFKAAERFKPEEYSSISRIALKLHFVLNLAPNAEIGPRGGYAAAYS